MSRLMKKRQLVLSVMIVALAAAVFANWYYTKPKTTPVSGDESLTVQRQEGDGSALNVDSTSVKGAEDYFAAVRLQRDTARDAALEGVKSVMNDLSGADGDAVGKARETLEQITENIKLESDVEALVSAKTGTDCVAVISGDAIQVVVPKELIDQTLALRISDIVLDATPIKADNIKIIGAE